MSSAPPNPHLVREIEHLVPSTALEAGCGAGSEALWLASAGWRVAAVDVSAAALERAAAKARANGLDDRIDWVEADLTTWQPDSLFDLVTTHYAHASMPQLDFYARLAEWVRPKGSLFIVGHLHTPEHDRGENHPHGHAVADGDRSDSQPPRGATVTAQSIISRLDPARWRILTAEESTRTVTGPGDRTKRLHDVVVRARRRS